MIATHGRFVCVRAEHDRRGIGQSFLREGCGLGDAGCGDAGPRPMLFSPPARVPVCGLAELSDGATNDGETRWIGYVAVDDVDAVAGRVENLGGIVRVPPTDVPGITPIFDHRRSRNGNACAGQGSVRANGRRGAARTRTDRLARTPRRQLRDGVRFLSRAFWLAERHCRGWSARHVSAFLRWRKKPLAGSRPGERRCRCLYGYITSMSATSTRRRYG